MNRPFLSLLFALLAVAPTLVESVSAEAQFPVSVTLPALPGVIGTYCFECHDSASSEADLNLEELESGAVDPYHVYQILESIYRVIENKEMPPRDSEQPSVEERESMLAWLEARTAMLSAQFRDDPGPVVLSRLTKQQYRNVISDLTGNIVLDAGAYLPEEGGAGEGFDNVGAAQAMSTVQVEKFLEAGRAVLRHLRANPHDGFRWRPDPRVDIVEPNVARQEAVNDLLDWFAAQQNYWAFEHTDVLANRYGTAHGPYLAAAWAFHHCEEGDAGQKTIEDIAFEYDPPLSVSVVENWQRILADEDPVPPWTGWARAWQGLPVPGAVGELTILDRCNAIVSGRDPNSKPPVDDFAPAYELSFAMGEAREATLQSARENHVWPFEIEIGEAKELFLVVTSAGDGNRGDKAIWQGGLFHFDGGSRKPWHSVTKIRGANSGRIYQWGRYHDGGEPLRADGFGVTPPGALKIEVPAGAKRLTVELAVDQKLTPAASIQALILKEKPTSRMQSFFPGRLVFGGRSGKASSNEMDRELSRELRRVNLSVVGRTKRGLNAERNILSDWDYFDLKWIGGPWEDQDLDEDNEQAPYYLMVPEVIASASPEALTEYHALRGRLSAVAQVAHQKRVRVLREVGESEVVERAVVRSELDTPGALEVWKVEEEWGEMTRELLGEFARLAWRRPLSEEDEEGLFDLYFMARVEGLSFDASVKQALLGVLASPNFLYTRTPQQDSGNQTDLRRIEGADLASRLSFLVWNSIPDETLLEAAVSGELKDSERLREEVRRMLSDPRSRALAESFAGQLFGFVGFEKFTGPDPERFPDFTPELREAMYEEVVSFCHHLFQGDAPLTDLITARYSFLNQRLGEHYGVGESLPREEFVRTALPDERGGLAGMGLFLTRKSEPLRTSPVLRGTWVLESILGTELANPPANVPAISQDETSEAGASVREQLEDHRSDAACASCHDKIDPIGIALENFDPIGRWRETLLDGSSPEVVAMTYDGVPLNGSASLRAYLESREREVVAHISRKLLGYALGRSLGPGDRYLLERIERDLPQHGDRFPWLLEEIVLSPQFLNYRPTPNRE